nr:hypothetical protein [Tanacetum cinerariifolium]
VPEVYMHQFWDSIHKYENSYMFKMDKKKKFDLNLEIFKDIFQICPRVHGQNFDELPTDEDIVSFFKEFGNTVEIKKITYIVVDQMHQPWRTFSTIINRSLSRKTTGLDKLRLSRAHKTVSKRKNIGMHSSRDDYLIYTLRFMSTKEESQNIGARLRKSMTSPEIRESKAYKTYLGYATGAIPPKKARKFKKPSSSELYNVPASPEEPTRKSKRVKRPAKKSSDAPTASVVIRENPVKSLSKKKEKMIVKKRKGIDLLYEVALTKEAQYQEVIKKSLRDFYKTRPSSSGTVTKIAPSVVKIKPSVTNEGICAKPGVPDVTEEESTKSNDQERDNGDENTQSDSEKGSNFGHETDENELGSESDQEENEEEIEDDKEKKEDEFVKTPSNDTDDEDETNIKDKTEGDEDKGMDYTTN